MTVLPVWTVSCRRAAMKGSATPNACMTQYPMDSEHTLAVRRNLKHNHNAHRWFFYVCINSIPVDFVGFNLQGTRILACLDQPFLVDRDDFVLQHRSIGCPGRYKDEGRRKIVRYYWKLFSEVIWKSLDAISSNLQEPWAS
jgi:hypothetical protein